LPSVFPCIAGNYPSDLQHFMRSRSGPLHFPALIVSGIDDRLNVRFRHLTGIRLILFSLFLIMHEEDVSNLLICYSLCQAKTCHMMEGRDDHSGVALPLLPRDRYCPARHVG